MLFLHFHFLSTTIQGVEKNENFELSNFTDYSQTKGNNWCDRKKLASLHNTYNDFTKNFSKKSTFQCHKV